MGLAFVPFEVSRFSRRRIMENLELIGQLLGRFVLAMIIALGIVPAIGGAIIWKTFQIAKVSEFSYAQCWKAYFAAFANAYVLIMLINFIYRKPEGFKGLQIILFCGIPFLVVPLLLRNFTSRVLAVEAV